MVYLKTQLGIPGFEEEGPLIAAEAIYNLISKKK